MSKKKVVVDFIDHVEETLYTHTCIHKFNLVVKFSRLNRQEGDVYVHRWLNHAINNNVKDLSLTYLTTSNLDRLDIPSRHALPETLYRCASLETLDLFRCRFVKPTSGYGITLSLRKLSLYYVTIDEETLQNVVGSCSATLEELSIEQCDGFRNVRVNGGDKLKAVEMYMWRGETQIVEIWAPNLRRLSYGGNLESVEDSFVGSGEFENVEELMLHDMSVEPEFLQIIQSFPGLQKLELQRCGLKYDFLQLNREEIVSLIQTFPLQRAKAACISSGITAEASK